jgi:hypothetical protein
MLPRAMPALHGTEEKETGTVGSARASGGLPVTQVGGGVLSSGMLRVQELECCAVRLYGSTSADLLGITWAHPGSVPMAVRARSPPLDHLCATPHPFHHCVQQSSTGHPRYSLCSLLLLHHHKLAFIDCFSALYWHLLIKWAQLKLRLWYA